MVSHYLPADVNNAFDVAFWFADTALNENEYLQPQKLQRLLFIAQSYYAIMQRGRKLMPAIFVADEIGPIEPNVYMAFSKGRPDIDAEIFLPYDVEEFLGSIWRRFGHMSVERLDKITNETSAYREALQRGSRAEIKLIDMAASFVQNTEAPAPSQVSTQKIYRTQSGRPVQVKSWIPGAK